MRSGKKEMRSKKRGKRKNERTEIRQTLIEGETGKEEGNVWALDCVGI